MVNKTINTIIKASASSRSRLIIIRYLTTAWIALELFLYAKLLGPQDFGKYALTVQLVSFLTLIGAGSGMGYVYAFYKKSHQDIEDIYIIGSTIQYLGGSIIILLASYFTKSYFFISSIVLVIKIPYLVSEPLLRVRNKFIISTIGRASGSILTSLIIGGYYLFRIFFVDSQKSNITLDLAIKIMLAGNIIGHFIYYSFLHLSKAYEFKIVTSNITRVFHRCKEYWKIIINPSLLYTFSSVLFVTYTFIDRLFLEHFYAGTALSSYSLAWQIAQSVLLILTSLNLIAGIKIGEYQEKQHSERIKIARQQLIISLKASLVALVFASTASWLLSISFYSNYEGLFLAATILSTGYLFFGVAGSITMVLYFENKLIEIFISYCFLLLMSLIANTLAIAFSLSYFFPLIISSLSLILVSIFLIVRYISIYRNYNKIELCK